MDKQPPRNEQISVRVSAEERKAITTAAKADHRYLADWIRTVAVIAAQLRKTKP